jgi:hypothetical protein
VKEIKGRRRAGSGEGTAVTTRCVAGLLTGALAEITEQFQERPDLLLLAWPEIIGPRLAGMAQAVSFKDGILTVKVNNSTLHSLLSRHDKYRLLAILQQKFPKIPVTNIIFKIA